MRYLLSTALFILIAFLGWDMWRFSKALPSFAHDRLPNKAVDLLAVVTGGQGRIKRAVDLFVEGSAHHLLISGVSPGSSLESIFSSNGVETLPPNYRKNIFLGNLARSTIENVKEIKSLIVKNDYDSVMLVTSSYHMPRLYRLLQKELARWPERKVELYFACVESPNFPDDLWWESLTGWQVFATEYLKSLMLLFHLDSVL
jgi:uncharacterized SAM-binding protein YcdF (DUF218 family)